MLASRYDADGRPGFKLSEAERSGLDRHIQKLSAGQYVSEHAACPVCRKEGGEILARKDRYGIPLNVVICEDCGLIRTEPRMDAKSYAEFYRDEYRALYSGKDEPDENFFAEQVRHGGEIQGVLSQHGFAVGPGDLVVEVGCGAGGILEAFRAKGARVVGCDPGVFFLRFGREQKGLDLRLGFLRDLVLPKKAKVVIYSHVVEHILDLGEELKLLREILALDGVVYVEVPSVKNIHRDGYNGDLLLLLQNAHTYHFTARSLQNVMAVNGYTPLFVDEMCRGAFRPSAPLGWRSDYADVMRFLRRAELTRHLYWFRPGPCLRTCIRILPSPLKRTLKRLIASLRGWRESLRRA